MAKTSASGHTKNVDNLDTLIPSVTGYGAAYNPAKASLKLPALQALAISGRTIIAAEHSAEVATKNASDARSAIFDLLGPFITRIMNALRASGASEQAIEAAYMIARKIKGTPASSKKPEVELAAVATDAKPVRHITTRHMDFESRLDNFDLFIKQLASIPQYNPNEPELKVAGLTAHYNDLKAKNTAAVNALTQLSNARITRDDTLYRDSTGLVDIALDTKVYVKSVFGASSPQYKQIAKLTFRKPKSK